MSDDPVAHAGAKMMQSAAIAAQVAEAASQVAAMRARGRASRMLAEERIREATAKRDRTVAEHALTSRLEGGVQGMLPDPVDEVSTPIDDVRCGRLLDVHKDAERFYQRQLDASWVPEYLAGRGLESAVGTSSAWAVGYAPDGWTTTTDHLRKCGHSEQDLLDAGVSSRSSRGTLVDRFRDRLMVSVRNTEGETVGFTGRANPETVSQRVPKWLNSPETELYRKGAELPGVYEHRVELAASATPVVVESPFDAMAVTAASDGRCVGVAACGTALTSTQVDVLKDTCTLDCVAITVAFDGDAAGQKAALRAFDALNRQSVGEPQVVVLPVGEDPASMWEKDRGDELAGLFRDRSQPLADLVVDAKLEPFADKVQWPEGRVNAMHAVVPTIASLPMVDVGRQVVRVSQRLDLPAGTVTAAMADHVSPADSHVVPFVQAELRARQQSSQSLDRGRSR